MDMQKLNPWNWFKHEEKQHKKETVPIKRDNYLPAQHPLSDILQLHSEIDRVFDEAFRGFPLRRHAPRWEQMFNDDFTPAFRASVNVASDDQQYMITLEAPGMEQKDLTIELKDRALFIKGDKQQQQEEKDKHYYRVERHYGSFERVLAIPDDADADEINATMKNGVLSIQIPRKELPKSDVKRIEIGSKQ